MYQKQNYQGQNFYNNPQNAYNNYQNQNNLSRKNQANFSNNKEAKINPQNLNQKYGDLNIQTFFNDGRMQNLSGKDLELKSKLEVLTNQYMAIFDNVNNMANKFSGGDDEMLRVGSIEKELADIDSYNATEYGKFIGELFEISKDPNILQYDYKKYKSNPIDSETILKKTISDNKYEVILGVNKNTTTQENLTRLNNYIRVKKNKSNNNSNYNSNYNQNKPNESQNKDNFHFGESIYGNQNQNNNNNKSYQEPFGFGNSIYNNNNNNNNYENPNEIGNGNIYGKNYNPNQYEPRNYNEKIRVNFICEGKDNFHEYNAEEPAESLLLVPFTLKDNPKIYDKKGNFLSYELIKDLKIKDIFNGIDPILNIY